MFKKTGKLDQLTTHILPVSATMLGVCMTVISVLQVVPKTQITPYADGILAIASLIFMVSTLMSYLSIRKRVSNSQKLEIWADILFMLGLGLMTLDSLLVAFDIF
jgi:hypothetical protein